jgi:HK97 family phage major capsid protein
MKYSEKHNLKGDLVKGLREEMAYCLEEFESLKNKNTLTSAENERKNKLADDMIAIENELSPLEEKENQSIKKFKMSKSNNFNKGGSPYEDDPNDEPDNSGYLSFQIKKSVPVDAVHPLQDYVLRNYDVPEVVQKSDWSKVLSAFISGQAKDSTTERAVPLAIKSGANGSALMTEMISSKIWEAGLEKSRLAQSGMSVKPMSENTVRIPTITEYPEAEWLTELTQQSEKDVTISTTNLTLKTVRSWTTIGAETMLSGHGVDAALRRAFSVSLGTAIDTAGLLGTGSPEPTGILNMSNKSYYSHPSDLENFDPILELYEQILNAHGEVPSHSVMSPRTWKKIQQFKTQTEENPLQLPPALRDHTFYDSAKVPNNYLFFGNFSSLVLGVGLQITLIQSPVLSDKFAYSFLGVGRCDIASTRESDLGVLEINAT